jgi:hypothetical protein
VGNLLNWAATPICVQVARGNDRTRLHFVQFEWEQEPQTRPVRLVSASAQVGDPVCVTVAGTEVEGCIETIEASTVHVRIGRRFF